MVPPKPLDFPPLGRRIVIVGSSGSGKTTLARSLASRYNLPHVEIDSLHFEPNWVEVDFPVLRTRIDAALSGSAWVVDGNYAMLRDIIWARGDTLIWLELPLGIVLWRLLSRTFTRIITQEELWQGNRENLRSAFFSKDSLVLYMLKTRKVHHNGYPLALKQPEYCHLKLIHLRTPAQVKNWLDSLEPG
jgi:adenylate kinase family enzyme